jgi:hypothetical protein
VEQARTFTPNDWIVLALVAEGRTHGWALASQSLFLVKVMLGQRTGRPVESLLVAQRGMLGPLLGLLEAQLDDAGPRPSAGRTLRAFRLEAAGSAVRFIDEHLDSLGRATAANDNGVRGADPAHD